MRAMDDEVVGTFLYAALAKDYIAHKMVFTGKRLIIAMLNWEDNTAMDTLSFSAMASLLSFVILGFPLPTAPKLDATFLDNWSNIKNHNKGRPLVSYERSASDELADIGKLEIVAHGIQSIPYYRIKKVRVGDEPLTRDYRIDFQCGFPRIGTMLIPDYSLDQFKELIAKTPLASKLDLSYVIV